MSTNESIAPQCSQQTGKRRRYFLIQAILIYDFGILALLNTLINNCIKPYDTANPQPKNNPNRKSAIAFSMMLIPPGKVLR